MISMMRCAGVLVLAVSPALAQYHFTEVAAFAADPYPFIQEPAINNGGAVTFMHTTPGSAPGAEGLFLFEHGHPRTIVASGFVDARGHSLSQSGHTAFVDASDGKVYRAGPSGHRTLIAEPEPDPEFEFFDPSINARGTVAFIAQLDEDGNTAVFMGRGGDVTTISDAEEDPLDYHSAPVINDQDEVAFSAYDTEHQAINVYVYRRGRLTLLYPGGSDPVFNNRGQLAFTRFGTTPGTSTILRGDGGALTTIASSGGPLVNVFATDVNDRGEVVFRAGLATGGQALYVGNGSKPRRVAGTGDTVLGRTVAAVSAGSINASGEVAFDARFTDGTSAVIRATPDRH